MRIACVGGGPAGLYFALLLKLREPRHDITIFERSVPGATRGWGVVFWGDLLEKLYSADPKSACEIEQASFPWDNQVVDVRGAQVLHAESRGYGIKRQRLLGILADRALGSGVRIEFDHEVMTSSQLPEVDLIVACDGVNSQIRRETKGFYTDVRLGGNKYIWLGTDKVFESFTFPFVQTDCGWIWAHAYGVDAESSTFIVECSAETWASLGFDTMPPEDCLSLLEKIFERHLDGHQLIGQTSGETNAQWLSFRTVTNKHWYDGKTVLAGDAAHTTHFTIGSGTRLAIEDAIALADNLQRHGELKPALQAYEKERQAEVLLAQIAARFSAQWFENVPRYIDLTPRQFSTLLRRRLSPLLPHLSPRLYYWLYPTSREVPALRGLRRWAGPRVIKVYRHTRLSPLWARATQRSARNTGPRRSRALLTPSSSDSYSARIRALYAAVKVRRFAPLRHLGVRGPASPAMPPASALPIRLANIVPTATRSPSPKVDTEGPGLSQGLTCGAGLSVNDREPPSSAKSGTSYLGVTSVRGRGRLLELRHGDAMMKRLRLVAAAAVVLTLMACAPASSDSATGWKLKWSTNFSTSVQLGQFSGCDHNVNSPDHYCSNLPASVRSQWWAYPYPWPDTASQRNYPLGGYYDPAHTVWISGRQMHIRIFRTTSWIHSAAVVPKEADGVKYGKFIETFSVSQAAPGYKAAHLLWPAEGNQNYEVDFPENTLDSGICAYAHSMYQADQAAFCPDVSWTGWHTSEIQWAPGSLTFYLDGKQIGHVTGDWVPDETMAWIIQNESALRGPSAPPDSSAQINISHVAVYSYTG